jgi:hypothetical protein
VFTALTAIVVAFSAPPCNADHTRVHGVDRDRRRLQRAPLQVVGSEAIEVSAPVTLLIPPVCKCSAGPVVPMVSEPDVSILAAYESSTS